MIRGMLSRRLGPDLTYWIKVALCVWAVFVSIRMYREIREIDIELADISSQLDTVGAGSDDISRSVDGLKDSVDGVTSAIDSK